MRLNDQRTEINYRKKSLLLASLIFCGIDVFCRFLFCGYTHANKVINRLSNDDVLLCKNNLTHCKY